MNTLHMDAMSLFCSSVFWHPYVMSVYYILQFQRNFLRFFIQTSNADKYWLIRSLDNNSMTLIFPTTLTFTMILTFTMTLIFPINLCSISLFRISQSLQEIVQDFL